MIRLIIPALILICLISATGCQDKVIPATSETTSVPSETPTPDPFVTQAPKVVEEKIEEQPASEPAVVPAEPESVTITPSPVTPVPVADPWKQVDTNLPSTPTSFAEPITPAVEPTPAPPTPPSTEPMPELTAPPMPIEPTTSPPTPEPSLIPPLTESSQTRQPAPPSAEPPTTPPITPIPEPVPMPSLVEPIPEPVPEPFVPEDPPVGNPLRTEPKEETPPVTPPPPLQPEPMVEASKVEAPSEEGPPTVPENVEVTKPAETPTKRSTTDPLVDLFVDWPKPKLLLVFTGFMNGYVEPCGCAGMDQMKGGLSRRHTFFKALEKKGWPMLPIDAGNLNKGFGSQEELKFNIVIDNAYRMMKYGAVGIGNRELLFPSEVLILYSVDSPGNKQRYTSANVAIYEFNPEFTVPYRIFEEGDMKVGVMSVVAPSLLKNVNNQDIVHEEPVTMIKSLLPQFAGEKCDKRVLLVHGTTPEIEKIVKAVPGQFDYVVPGDTPAEPPFRPRWIGDSLVVDVGEKGKFAVAVGVYDDPDKPFRYERIPLDARFENSEPVVALMQFYQNQLQQVGLEGLGIKPIPDRRAAESGKFVGSKVCADCHEPSYSVWRKSKHATAWRSLVETSKPARTHDPECIACHVVGWNPTEFLPYENGFMGEKETPHLLDVGCESCHGPGELHVKAEQGSDEAQQEKLRKAVRLPVEGNVARKLCIQCHDGDNSPSFDFETYWPKIVHTESEE